MQNYKSPVYNVKAVPIEKIQANAYNPNHVAVPEMKLLYKDIYERENGCLPVVVIDKDLSNRMASTIRHNRARGSHSIELMTNIVADLVKSGMSDAWIMKNIGMDAEELLRLKQISGLAELFKNKEFSKGWEE